MNKVFIFALGVATGSLVTWKIVEEKYKKISNEEIASVVKQFEKRYDELNSNKKRTPEDLYAEKCMENPYTKEDVSLDTDNNELDKYKNQVNILGYSAKEDEEEEVDDTIVELEPTEEHVAPYVISPEEYGETGNETVSLMYYSDNVLADDDDEIVPNPESIIGKALEHFGEYEDDCVHVRNESLECDYEILKSEKTFDEVYKGDD